MGADEVDGYIAGFDEPRRTTLEQLRRAILAAVPDAEQGLSYGVPAFRLGATVVAGFSAAVRHVSYLPHSGDVLGSFRPDELAPFQASKGALRMPVDEPLPAELVAELVARRRTEAGA